MAENKKATAKSPAKATAGKATGKATTSTKTTTNASAAKASTKASTTSKTAAKKPATEPKKAPAKKDLVIEEVTDATLAPNDEVDEKADVAEKGSQRPKNYHISLREDGKWQVKLSKGGKALKLFNTQAEAISFAKEKAKNQEGHITIHKVDGKIRKQRY